MKLSSLVALGLAVALFAGVTLAEEKTSLKSGPQAGEELAVQRVYRARGGRAAVGLAQDLLVTLPRGQAERAEFKVELAPRVFAPLTKSDRVGVLRALVDGKVVAEAPIHPLADVPRGNIFRRIWDTILSWFA